MITVKLMGGLGNQLFQLAYALHIASETDDKITLDVSVYAKYKIRKFALRQYFNDDEFQVTYKRSFFTALNQNSYRIYQKVMRVINCTDYYGKWPFYLLSKFGLYYNFDQKFYPIEHAVTDKTLYGYFQSEKYFLKSVEAIKSRFNLTYPLNEKETYYHNLVMKSNSVALSMRLGDDYFNCENLNVCDSEYYHLAIKKIIDKFGNNLTFFVFSDDLDKASKLLSTYKDINIIYVSGLLDYQSLRLMSKCSNFIIPNSSFSWWGAYLSDNINKDIICPNKWFNNVTDDSDIYTNKMIRLKDY